MNFQPSQFSRKGRLHPRATMEEAFPLLCPKREEEWIPGWECEVIWSRSGYNEEGAIFRTTRAYGTELYWTTLQYDISSGIVDFLITAPCLYVFRFRIEVSAGADGLLTIVFLQTFTSVSEEGSSFLDRYRIENFDERLGKLEDWMNRHLQEKNSSRS